LSAAVVNRGWPPAQAAVTVSSVPLDLNFTQADVPGPRE
jgi:hypothetical protein